MKRKRTILFVCIGNTCRSPMAEAIARSICKDDLLISSRGLEVIEDRMNSQAIVVVKNKLNINIEYQLPRGIYNVDLSEVDTIYSMDNKVTSFLQLPGVFDGEIVEIMIEDPFGKDIGTYYATFESIYLKLKEISIKKGHI